MERSTSRRNVLRGGAALAGVGAVTSIAGCSQLDSLMGGGAGSTQVEDLPEDAAAAISVDVDAVLEDEATKEVTNAALTAQAENAFGEYTGPEDFDEALADVEEQVGLDPRDVDVGTLFYDYDAGTVDNEFGGVVFTTEWSEDELVDSMEKQGSSFEEDEYNGTTIYSDDPEYGSPTFLGVLGDGQYVAGSEAAVKDLIDVRTGDADGMDEALRDGFDTTTSGAPLRFVSAVPDDNIPEEYPSREGTIDLDGFDQAVWVAGSVYVDGDTRGLKVTIKADEEAAAGDMVDAIDGLVALAGEVTTDETLTAELDAIEVEQDGDAAVVTYETSIDNLAELVEESLSRESSSRTEPTRAAPQAVFSFDYEGSNDTGTLTITHDGGDTIKQSELYVGGIGFAASASVDMTAGGQWAGSTSGSLGGEPAVVAGDSVTVGVESDYSLQVLYESAAGDSSATLAMNQGPDA